MGATLTELSIKLSANAVELKQSLDGARSDLSKFKNDVESKFSGVTKAFGLISGAALGAMGAFESFKKVMNATGDGADQLEKMMTQAETSTDSFFNTIANGDFSNLLDNLKNAITIGGEYADMMDEIEDRKRGLSLQESQKELEILKLKETYSNKLNSKDVRLDALKQMKTLEIELGQIRESIAKEGLDASLKQMTLNNTLTQEQIDNVYLLFETQTRLDAQYYNELQDKLYNNKSGYSKSDIETMQSMYAQNGMQGLENNPYAKMWDEIVQLQKKSNEEVKNGKIGLVDYAGWLYQINNNVTGSEKTIDGFISATKELSRVRLENQQSINDLTRKTSALELGIGTEQEKILNNAEKELLVYKDSNKELEKKSNLLANYFANQTDALNNLNNDNYKLDGALDTVTGWDLNSGASWQQDTPVAGAEDVYEGSGQDYKVLDTIDRNKQRAQQFSEDIGFILSQGTADMIGNFAEGIGAMLAGDKVDFGKVILMGLVQMAESIGRLAIQMGLAVKALQTSLLASPMLAIIGGTALLAIAGAVKASLSSAAKFAEGGIVGGYSFSGDKVPAMVNSGEMILNSGQQTRLFKMLNGGVNTNSSNPMQVEFVIAGSQLVGVLNNQSRKSNIY